MVDIPADDIIIHRFPTLSDPSDWFEIAMRGDTCVYVQRRHTIHAETIEKPENDLSPRTHRYIQLAKEYQDSQGAALDDLPRLQPFRLIVHQPV